MIVIRPFERGDLIGLQVQAGQHGDLALIGDLSAHDAACFEGGPAWTAVDAGGRVIGCAGLIIQRPHHGTAWAMLGDIGPIGLLAATRAALAVLDASSLRRIDAMIAPGFDAARQWAIRLGFELEGIMRCWGPDGSDWSLWSRTRGI